MFNIVERNVSHLVNNIKVIIFFITLSLGCTNASEDSKELTILKNVEQEIKSAASNKDFRLYATSGRRITFPGINNDDYMYVEKNCGKKYFPKTGDVISSEEQRIERKKKIDYIKAYNFKMLIACRNR